MLRINYEIYEPETYKMFILAAHDTFQSEFIDTEIVVLYLNPFKHVAPGTLVNGVESAA